MKRLRNTALSLVCALLICANLMLLSTRSSRAGGGAGPIATFVTNTFGAGQTMPVNDVMNPGVDPFQSDVSFFADSSGNPLGGGNANSFMVPANKRLVIDGVSWFAFAPGSTYAYLY